MPSNTIIKTNAKTSLQNKWSAAISVGAIILSVFCLYIVLLQLILIPITTIFNEVTALFIVIALSVVFAQLFGMPLLYGALRWFWFTSSDAEVRVSEIFCYLGSGKEYLRALSLSFRIFIRSSAVLFFCFLPSLVVTAISSPTTYSMFNSSMPYWASSVWALGNVLTIFGVVMSFVLLLRYFAAPILMINDPSITPHEALDLSVIITKNANGKTLSFVFSFFGWAVLSLLYLPILFTLPYFLVSYSVFCRFLINHYNRKIATHFGNNF
ncbi:MAG: DUF975 family protein [Ruminococcaceae bacterium]|nr:DUF975 family protein [Oscillospiraceae bacterium]